VGQRWSLVGLIVDCSSIDTAPDGRRLPHPITRDPTWSELDKLLDLGQALEYPHDEVDAAEEASAGGCRTG
jgi:hypothetical protein